SVFVHIGVWYDRFVIIVPYLAHYYEPCKVLNYHIGITEAAILLGNFGWFFICILQSLRFLPGLSIAEIKEILPPPMSRQQPEHVEHDERERLVEVLPTGYKEFERR